MKTTKRQIKFAVQTLGKVSLTNDHLLKEMKRATDQARGFMLEDSFGIIKKKDFEQRAKNRFGLIIKTLELAIKKAAI